ncbi:MAG: hypothetical protein OHK0019_00530 [Saprospiraceae bacterium]
MITKDDILQKSVSFAREVGTANLDFATYYFQHGAHWANEQNSVEIAAKDAEIAEVLGALRDLYDEQNGAPLIEREQHWQTAYDKAGELLKKYGK